MEPKVSIEVMGKGKSVYLWIGERDGNDIYWRKIVTVSGVKKLRKLAHEILEKVEETNNG